MKLSGLLTNFFILQILSSRGSKGRPSHLKSQHGIISQPSTSLILQEARGLSVSEFEYEDTLFEEEEEDDEEEEEENEEEEVYSIAIEDKNAPHGNLRTYVPPPGLTIGDKVRDDVTLGDARKVPDVTLGHSQSSLNVTLDNSTIVPHASDYMLELYERFSKSRSDLPQSNIIRSFNNINSKDAALLPNGSEQIVGSKTRFHSMVFSISSITSREIINLAELRMFTLVERDRNTYSGVDRKVSVFDVIHRDSKKRNVYRLISSKHIYGRNSGWETFDVTSAVRRWVHNVSSIQILEVRIQTLTPGDSRGDMDINVSPNNKQEPLLVVYSTDDTVKHQSKVEMDELLMHEYDVHRRTSKPKPNKLHERVNTLSSSRRLSRQKRSRGSHRTVCKRRPMFVDFEDIQWHEIIAPRGYQAYQCAGKCYIPLSSRVSPSKHAVIQAILHAYYPRKFVRACCVPTKLEPISILYIDKRGVVTYKYYDDMVVSECGCR